MVAAIAYALITNLSGEKDTNYEVGDKAPNFELTQVNHNNEAETIKLSEFEGKGVMLNFWGTWCPPCRDEMPFMEKIYPEYQEKGVEIVAVNLDQIKLKIEKFIDKFDLILLVQYDKYDEVRVLLVVGSLPSSI